MRKLLYAIFVFFSGAAYAAIPAESIIIEAENMRCSNNAWVKRPHYPGYYGSRPSNNAHLMGANQIPGTAETTLSIKTAGKYNIWVRYLDLAANRTNSGFIITVKQNSNTLAVKEFDRNSMRSDAASKKKWGSGYAMFVWDKLTVDFPAAGEYTLAVSKLQKGAMTTAGGRHLDVFLITDDLAFAPRINDLYPLFFRIKMLDQQTTPAAVHLFGIRSEGSFGWYTGHHNINRKGFFSGADNGAGNMKNEHLRANETTPWYELTSFLSFKGFDRISFELIHSYHAARPSTAAFEIQFSRTPSEEKLWKTFSRTGPGCGLQVAINLADNEIISEIDASAVSVEYAKLAGALPGKMPERFPMTTGLSIDPAKAPEIVVQNEFNAVKSIGLNGCSSIHSKSVFPVFRATKFCFHLNDGCLGRPNAARIESTFKSYADQIKAGDTPRPYVINIMDEPGLKATHLTQCAYCKGEFANYLKNNNIQLTNTEFTANPADGIRYYWSMRYANSIITRYFQTASAAAAKYFPDIPITANFATTLVYDGNMLTDLCDWYDILGSGALTYGWGEDWANHTRTYQSNGFYTDVLRSACKINGYDFGIYDVISGKNAWDIQAKGYMAIGRGAKAMHFVTYGPWYVMSSDASNQNQQIYTAIKNIAFPTGAIENELLAASPIKADAAMLFSRTSDIWNMKKDNIFGKERVFLNLLFKHCSYSMDVIEEESLAKELKNYPLLVACDSHIRKEFVPVIVNWVKNGGTLYMTAGALQFDESNNPLGLRKMLGIPESKLTITQNPATAQHTMPRLKTLDTYADMPLISAIEKPLHQVKNVEKGKVIADGFFPGISYIGKAKMVKNYSFLNYLAAHRKYIASLPLGVKPFIFTDNYLIETSMLTGKDTDVIVLANFVGSPAETTLTFAGDYRNFNAVNCTITQQKKVDGKNQLTVKLVNGGAYITAVK